MDEELKKHLELMKDCIFEERAELIYLAEQALANGEDGFLIVKLLFILQATPDELELFAPILKSAEFSDWLNYMQKYVHWNEHGNEASLSDCSDTDPYGVLLRNIVFPLDTLSYLLSGEPDEKCIDLARRLVSISQKFRDKEL